MGKKINHTLLMIMALFLLFNSTWSQKKIGADEKQKNADINKYIAYLKNGSIIMKRIAAQKLGKYKDKRSIPFLLRTMAQKDYKVQFYAKQSLTEMGEMVIPVLLTALKNNRNNTIRLGAVEVLGNIKHKEAIPSLINSLKNDRNQLVRAMAARSLGIINDHSAVSALIKSLKDQNWRVRAKSAEALGLLKDARATNSLIEALNDNNSYVRLHSAGALGRIKDPKSVPYLITRLKDSDTQTRETAVWALGKIKDKRAIKALVHSLMKDKNGGVRREAREALKTLGYSYDEIDGIRE